MQHQALFRLPIGSQHVLVVTGLFANAVNSF